MSLGRNLGALGLAGPAGGGGYIFGVKPDLSIHKVLVPREKVKCDVRVLGSDSDAAARRELLAVAAPAHAKVITQNGHVVDYKYIPPFSVMN